MPAIFLLFGFAIDCLFGKMILFTGISFLLRWNPGDEIIYLIELTIDYLFSQMWIMDAELDSLDRVYEKYLTGISFSPR